MIAEETEHSNNNDEDKEEDPFCEYADKNPRCPYLVQINSLIQANAANTAATTAASAAIATATLRINQQADEVSAIKKALIGEDMQGGLVKKVNGMQSTWKSVQPFLLVALTGVFTWVAAHIHW